MHQSGSHESRTGEGGAARDQPPGFIVGAGRTEIAYPDLVWPFDGFGGQYDPVHARVVLVTAGSTTTAIVSIEQTSLPSRIIDAVAKTVADVSAIALAQTLVAVTHTFSTPHLPEAIDPDSPDSPRAQAAEEALIRAVADATLVASSRRRPARLRSGIGHCRVNVNRDVPTRDGWWLGTNERGTSDPAIVVLRFDDLQGTPLAFIAAYAVQSSIMNEVVDTGGWRSVTADLLGAAARYVESEYGDEPVCAFLIGAAGDQAPAVSASAWTLDATGVVGRHDVGDRGLVLVEVLGRRLGAATVLTAEAASRSTSAAAVRVSRTSLRVQGQRAVPRERLRATNTPRYVPDEDSDIPVWCVGIGDAVIIGVQPELSAVTGMAIRNGSPFPVTAVATMVNGGAKYLPDAEAFDRSTYEAMSSRFARGAAEQLTEATLRLLDDLARAVPPGSPMSPDEGARR